jgi:nucleotide-binding universal stress UspA family protein
MFQRVICAVDQSAATGKVLRHAAGFAVACGARLSLVHVTSGPPTTAAEEPWRRLFFDAIPYYASYVEEPDIQVVTGPISQAILAEAARTGADLIVCGSRGRGPVAGWLLGSTTRSLMQATTRPLLLIPANEIDIVMLGERRVDLPLGTVLTPIDFGEHNATQLHYAGAIASAAGHPLELLTVLPTNDPTTDHEAAAALRARARKLTTIRAHSVIVRRGKVAEEIGRCAAAEDAGLIVMGLRHGRRGQRPGAIASAVLHSRQPAVLAVPDVATPII